MSSLKTFWKDESGATAIEYGLIAALVSITAILALQYLGGELTNTFNHVAGKLGEGVKAGGGSSTGG